MMKRFVAAILFIASLRNSGTDRSKGQEFSPDLEKRRVK